MINKYLEWVNNELASLFAEGQSFSVERLVTEILALACNAHTRFVHIHPFSDGNGRSARILSGIVLDRFQMPMPMFTKEGREEYMRAVADATVRSNSTSICRLHAQSVDRSLKLITRLSTQDCQME